MADTHEMASENDPNSRAASKTRDALVVVIRHESTKEHPWDRVEKISKMVSLAAIPLVLGIGGWVIQRQLQNQTVRRDYVQLAVSILKEDSDKNVTPALRGWAVDLLNSTSPTQLTPKALAELKSGEATLPFVSSLPSSTAFEPTAFVGQGFTPAEFREYVKQLNFHDWRPQFLVIHNTSVPKLSQWHMISGEERMKSLATFYTDDRKSNAGPHLFVADDKIWVFNPLTKPGIHSPSWNKVSIGIEIVGDFDNESFTGPIQDNTVSAMITLCQLLGIDPASTKFHSEDPRTPGRSCPGKNVVKPELIRRVTEGLAKDSTQRRATG